MLNNRMQVLVTGATGFVGRHLCQYLLQQGYQVKAVGRQEILPFTDPHLIYYCIENIDIHTNWQPILEGVDVIVHLASRVHVMQDKGMQALALYQAVNVKGTQQLARAALQSDVKRFIYVSTIKVNGEKTIGMPFRAEEQPRPLDAYSLSKLQAEQILQEEARRSGMDWVIIRPPLIYGSGVKGNFKRLLQLAKSRLPLPLYSVRNRRSFVYVYNLCSFIECCLTHPHAPREVFLVSDNHDLSTPELIRLLRKSLGKHSGLFPFPVSFLKLLGSITGKRRLIDRMLDSLQVNIEKSTRLLNWQPPFSVEQALTAMWEDSLIK